MTPVVRTLGGREVEMRLPMDALDQIAKVNPQFGDIAYAFVTGLWRWEEVRIIVSAAIRPHGLSFEAVFDDLGSVDALAELASEIWAAAMPRTTEDVRSGKRPAVAGQVASILQTSSATA